MKRLILGVLGLYLAFAASAADFFSDEPSPKFFTFGARIGLNTSNRTVADKSCPGYYHNESWGTGFDLGVVANLNFRDFISLQPGFFFESRSGSFVLMDKASDGFGLAGKRRSYNFTVPVIAVFGFNVTDDLRWTVEVGPYVSFLLDSEMKNVHSLNEATAAVPLYAKKPASADFGFKMGTGLKLLSHYYIGAHYMAGCTDAWKNGAEGIMSKNFGGVTKAWVFTLGYDF